MNNNQSGVPDGKTPTSNAGFSQDFFQQLQDLAVEAAVGAAEIVRARRADLVAEGGLAAVTEAKGTAEDPVTVVDKASEDYIVNYLSSRRPNDGFLGEEGALADSSTGVTWVIDPIDGTVNFLYAIPEYAVSIGAVVNGEPVAGAVVNVALGDTYYAGRGLGAFVQRPGEDAVRLFPSDENRLSMTLLATGFAYKSHWRKAQAELLVKVLPRVRDIRRAGSAALDICHVAEGRVDAYYEHGTKAWDFAGATIIAREAGAVVHHPGMQSRGDSPELFLAGNPGIAQRLGKLLFTLGAGEVLPV
ncbi:inositol monophosphatase [Corynebacterium phocae]|nr:inositol monophosphatase [Corynebacterium phocae]